jgi:hypothetical protein
VGFPDGVKPDAVDDARVYLIKACSTLRLTRQIRMATLMATQTGRKLRLQIRQDCALAPDLETFIRAQGDRVEVVRA